MIGIVNIDPNRALEVLLNDAYLQEFEMMDGWVLCHPSRINFYEWLRLKEIISEEECDRIQQQIANEYED